MANELIFIVEEDFEGGYTATAVEHSIITQGDTIDEVKVMIKDAVECHFEDEENIPKLIRLHFVKDEMLII